MAEAVSLLATVLKWFAPTGALREDDPKLEKSSASASHANCICFQAVLRKSTQLTAVS